MILNQRITTFRSFVTTEENIFGGTMELSFLFLDNRTAVFVLVVYVANW
jgi:hypothetical protein